MPRPRTACRPRRTLTGVRLAAGWLAVLSLALPTMVRGEGDGAPRPDATLAGSTLAGSPLLAPLSDGAQVPLPELDPAVPSPQTFLAGPLGSRFHRHEEILRYLETLAATSDRVAMWEYGRTWEGRPLTLLALSSPENIQRLEEIRQRHLRLASPARLPLAEREALIATQPVFVWLGYGIHGNESSSAEAALGVAYVLAAARGEWERRLREVVVLIDPLSNPDGRERYVTGYLARRGREPDADPSTLEHAEPWPGGRFNHYFFDLNRDWAWASQAETRHRLAEYRRWEPQVHVDLHEMQSSSTYFFPPPADPVNPAIDRRVLAWLETFGQGNARAFDELGWLFYNRQQYDLFYPGYGDSYPSLRGAVGMTYEVAGGGRAGQVVRQSDGSLWTLADRLARHLVTSLATVETAAAGRTALLRDFTEGRLASSTHLPQSIVWSAEQGEARALAELLSRHGIAVGRLSAVVELAVRPGIGGSEERRLFAAGTYAVSTAQPLAGLVEALLKVSSPLSPGFVERQRRRVEANLEAEFFDITAWALPLAFGVDSWLVYGEPPAQVPFEPGRSEGTVIGRGDFGWAVPPQGLASYRLAAELAREGVRHRLALAPFETPAGPGAGPGEKGVFPRGTLFLPHRGNPEDLGERLAKLADADGLTVYRLASGKTDRGEGGSTGEGVSLGSDDLVPVRPVVVGLASGEGLSPTSVGHLWYLLDREIALPHRRLALADLGEHLGELDVLILPEGRSFEKELGAEAVATLKAWVEAGGTLVVVGVATGETATWLTEVGLFEVPAEPVAHHEPNGGRTARTLFPMGESPGGTELAEEEDYEGLTPPRVLPPMLRIPGAVVATTMNGLHPLSAGVATPPPVLVRGSRSLPATGLPDRDVLVANVESPILAGFAWPEAEEHLGGSLLVGIQPRGRGKVIVFAQDPAFRGLWRATMPLFLNAVMFAPSW